MKIDSAFRHPSNNKKLYVFTEDKYYRYNMDSDVADSGYPLSIRSYWDNLPGYIDAAFCHPYKSNKLYFFKGSQYWRYDFDKNEIDSGYPKSISYGWEGIPDNIDAIFCHPSNKDKVYFFKGSDYYRYDWDNDKVDSGYPKRISYGWEGIPDNIDAIVPHPTSRDYIYFFKGNDYYKYKFSDDKLISGPRNTDDYWSFTSESMSSRLSKFFDRKYGRELLRKYIDAEKATPRCRVLKDDFHLGHKKVNVVCTVLRMSGHNAKEISRAVLDVYRTVSVPFDKIPLINALGLPTEYDLLDNPTPLCQALQAAGFPPEDIAEGALDIVDYSPDVLAGALSLAGISEDDVKDLFNDLGNEFLDFADDAYGVVDDVFDEITSWF